jgi:hypothetical protein
MTQFIRRHFILSAVLVLAASVYLFAQERITLTAPEAAPSVLTYRLSAFSLALDDPATAQDEGVLSLLLIGVERPVSVPCTYTAQTTPTATFLITNLQKANLASAYAGNASTGSLSQRIFHRLSVMNEAPLVCGGSLAGSLTGSPQ